MTIASPSRFVVADIKWLVREFQRFPPMARKIFGGERMIQERPRLREAVILCFQRPGIISRRKPLKYSVSGMVGRTG